MRNRVVNHFYDINSLSEQLQKFLRDYPIDKKDTFISLLASKDERQSISHLMELFVFYRLNRVFKEVEVEVPLAFANFTTPDFWVNKKIAVEVGTAFKKTCVNYKQIVSIFNEIHSVIKIENMMIHFPSKIDSLKIKEIRNIANDLLSRSLYALENNHFIIKTSQGIELSGNLVINAIDRETIQTYRVCEENLNLEEYKYMVQRNIRRKLGKYKPIASAGYPIVFVLFDYQINFNEQDYIEILFGKNKDTNEYDVDSIFCGFKYTSLSAVIIYIENKHKYFLYENPYAKIQLGTYKRYICNCFDIIPDF